MKRFWQILTLLMLALMVPASMCCQWSDKCASQACDCCSEPEQQDDEEHDLPAACPSDSIAHSQVPAPVALPGMQMIELADIVQTLMRLSELVAVKSAPVPMMTTAPPELPVTWVFVRRAALPARAPSELA